MSTKSQRHPFLGLALLVLCIGFVSMPREAYIGDAMSIRLASLHWVLKGSTGIDVSEKHALAETTYTDGQYFFFNSSRHTYYPKWGILNTLLFTPPLLVENWLHGIDDFFSKPRPQEQVRFYKKSLIFILNLYNLAFTLGIAFYLFKLAQLYTARITSCYVFVLSSLYATFLWNYLRAPSSEIFQIFFFAACAYHFIRFQRLAQHNTSQAWRQLAASTSFAGLLLLIKPYYLLLFPLLGVFAYLECRPISKNARSLLLYFLLPTGVFVAILLTSQWYQFGSPFETGYGQWRVNGRPHDFMALSNIPRALYGFFWSPSLNVFTHFPILLFAFLGFGCFWKRHRRELLFILATFGVFLGLISSFSNWSGQFCYGPRYLLFILPLLSLPLVAVTDWVIENPKLPGTAVIGALFLATILLSMRIQNRINSLPFMTALFLADTYRQLKVPDTIYYFENHHLGTISKDLLDYQKFGKPFPPLEMVRSRLSPALIQRFEEYQHSATFGPNFFFAY